MLGTDARANTVTVGPRDALATSSVDLRDATLHREGAQVDRVRLRYRSRPLSCRIDPAVVAGRHARLAIELLEPVDGAAPGQSACLMSGELIVGQGTIAG